MSDKMSRLHYEAGMYQSLYELAKERTATLEAALTAMLKDPSMPMTILELRERNAKHGLDVEYRPDGKPVLRDRAQRRKLLRIEGKHDNQGGYSD